MPEDTDNVINTDIKAKNECSNSTNVDVNPIVNDNMASTFNNILEQISFQGLNNICLERSGTHQQDSTTQQTFLI